MSGRPEEIGGRAIDGHHWNELKLARDDNQEKISANQQGLDMGPNPDLIYGMGKQTGGQALGDRDPPWGRMEHDLPTGDSQQ